MRLLIFLLAIFTTHTANGAVHVRGFFTKEVTKENVVTEVKKEITRKTYLDKEITVATDWLLSYAFDVYIDVPKSIEELQQTLKTVVGFDLVFWQYIDVIPETLVIAPKTCQNGGFLLPNNTCHCPTFTSGDSCEQLNCQRRGIMLKREDLFCKCPAGWYARTCEIRGCRPQVADQMDRTRRSFFLVLPATASMKNATDIITTYLPQTLQTLQAQEPGWLASFIVEIFYGTNTTLCPQRNEFDSIDALVQYIKSVKITLPVNLPTLQPMMKAISDVQNFAKSQLSNGILWAFTDTADIDGDVADYTLADNTPELAAAWGSLMWRTRPFFFYLGTPTADIAYSNKFETIRRFVSLTLGELIMTSTSELPILFESYLRRLYKAEVLDARTFTKCSSVNLSFPRDFDSQAVTLMVTLDALQNGRITVHSTDGTFLTPQAIGTSWAMFNIPPGWSSAVLNAGGSICSVKAFISTISTISISYIDDTNIDVGNTVQFAEMNMMVTADFKNIPLFYEVKFYSVKIDSAIPNDGPHYGYLRNNADQCTHPWIFEPLPRGCWPGPFNHKFVVSLNDGKSQRVRILPGYCGHTPTPPLPDLPPVIWNNNNITVPMGECQMPSNEAFGDPRFHDFRHIVFAVDVTASMSNTINGLLSILNSTAIEIQKDNVLRMYSLITFDDQSYRVDSSYYDINGVITALASYKTKLRQAPNEPTYSYAAANDAVKLSFVNPTIVHVFTANKPVFPGKNVLLNTFTQVNFYYISLTADIVAQTQFSNLRKQTNGRYITVDESQINLLQPLIVSATYETAFIEDMWQKDCSGGFSQEIVVDTSGEFLTILMTGEQISYNITDGTGTLIQNATVVFSNLNTIALKISGTQSAAGKWNINGSTTAGGCSVQARLGGVSNPALNVVAGFIANPGNDFLASLPFSQRGSNDTVYTAFRASDQKANITSFNLGDQTNILLTTRDSSSCAHNYITQSFMMPTMPEIPAAIYGTDANGQQFKRLLWYYTLDGDKTVCETTEVNEFGECACNPGYAGEYCYDPICLNGGSTSHGICQCMGGSAGPFCNEVVRELYYPPGYNTTTTLIPPTVPNNEAPTKATTPSGSNRISDLTVVIFPIICMFF